MADLISRQVAIDALGEEPPVWYDGENEIAEREQWRRDKEAIEAVPDVPIASAFTDEERYYISDIFQNYHCLGIKKIAEEDDICKSIFRKVGLLNG